MLRDAGPRRAWSVPWGLVAALGLIGSVESVLASHSERLIDLPTVLYRFAGQTAVTPAAHCEVLCFGDSQVKYGLYPRVIEACSGRSVYNLATPGAIPITSYWNFARSLRSGARPKAVVVDFNPSLLPVAPRGCPPWFAEVAGVRDMIQAGWDLHSASFTARLAMLQLSSFRYRDPLRARLLDAFRGTPLGADPKFDAKRRHWAANLGAEVLPEGHAPEVAEFWDEKGYCEASRHFHIDNYQYIQRILRLARSHDVRVFWLVTPLHPRVRQRREQLGLESTYTRIVRRMLFEFPELIVLDARHISDDLRWFRDAGHVSRQGAMALSAAVGDAIREGLSEPSREGRLATLALHRGALPVVHLEEMTESELAMDRTQGATRR